MVVSARGVRDGLHFIYMGIKAGNGNFGFALSFGDRGV